MMTWGFDEAGWLASLSTGKNCLIKRLQDFAPWFTWNVPLKGRINFNGVVLHTTNWFLHEKDQKTRLDTHMHYSESEKINKQTPNHIKETPELNKTLAFAQTTVGMYCIIYVFGEEGESWWRQLPAACGWPWATLRDGHSLHLGNGTNFATKVANYGQTLDVTKTSFIANISDSHTITKHPRGKKKRHGTNWWTFFMSDCCPRTSLFFGYAGSLISDSDPSILQASWSPVEKSRLLKGKLLSFRNLPKNKKNLRFRGSTGTFFSPYLLNFHCWNYCEEIDVKTQESPKWDLPAYLQLVESKQLLKTMSETIEICSLSSPPFHLIVVFSIHSVVTSTPRHRGSPTRH